MLDELRGEDPSERALRQAVQVGERVSLFHLEAFRPAERDHVRIEVDAPRFDARFAEEGQELAASAANVEDGRRIAKLLDVLPLAIHDHGARPAHPALEREVVEWRSVRARGWRRSGCGCSRRGSDRAALEAYKPLVELVQRQETVRLRSGFGLEDLDSGLQPFGVPRQSGAGLRRL